MIYKVTGWFFEHENRNILIPLQTEFEGIEIKNIEDNEEIYRKAENELLKKVRENASLSLKSVHVWVKNEIGIYYIIT